MVDAPAQVVDQPWVGDNGFPVIEARIPARYPTQTACLVIDISVGETLLDQSVAQRAAVKLFDAEPIHFPAGPAGRIEHGLLAHLQLGALGVNTAPVQINGIRVAVANLPPFLVDGIIGSEPALSPNRQNRPQIRNGETICLLVSDRPPWAHVEVASIQEPDNADRRAA